MALAVGVLLALAVGMLATVTGMERDRAYYPVVLIVTASYYALFAVLGDSTRALTVELLVVAGFLALALSGYRFSLWVVVAALAAHGVFDLIHGMVITNPGLPPWWPAFCLAFDVTIAVYLAWRLVGGRPRAAAPETA